MASWTSTPTVAATTPASAGQTPPSSVPSEFKLLKVTSTKVRGQELVVSGVTDLPDGSRISVTLNPADYPPDATFIGSDIDVNAAGGKFEGTLPIPQRPEFQKGPYVIETMFTPKRQAQSVLDAVGQDGERLAVPKKPDYNFKIMETELRLTKLDFKVKSASIPSRDKYPAGSPERLYIDVVTAWNKKDWAKMAAITQTTWRRGESDPKGMVEAQFELFHPIGIVSSLERSPGALSNMQVITATLEGSIGSRIHKRRVPMNIVKEGGTWGWNPTSALRQEEVP